MSEDKIVDIVVVIGIISVIILKCIGVIKISWLWLTAIIWVPFGLGIILAFFILLLFIIQLIRDTIKERIR